MCFEYWHNFYIFMLLSTVKQRSFTLRLYLNFGWYRIPVYSGFGLDMFHIIYNYLKNIFLSFVVTHIIHKYFCFVYMYTNVCVCLFSVFVVYWCILLSHVHVVIFEDCHKITTFFLFNFYELTENNCNYCSKNPTLY